MALVPKLESIVGASGVRCSVQLKGARIGLGEAFAVVSPATVEHALEALQACVDADVCVIPQGANTGLTGGSVPRAPGTGLDRPTVVINMRQLSSIIPIDGGKRMVCLGGAGIYDVLSEAKALGRESHSVLGSIFLNPSTAAGVALGSGGTQTRKGPVYTERLLYAKVNGQGKVEVVDTLGLKGQPAELYKKLESGSLTQSDVDEKCALPASQPKYAAQVCTLDKHVSRFNADTAGPSACRSEGKVMILASVHDTFAAPAASKSLWVSCGDLATAHKLKAEVNFAGGVADIPPSCEYMDKDAVRAVDEAGRVLCWMIHAIGIGPTLKALWDVKLKFEALPIPFAPVAADKALFLVNPLLPSTLPARIKELTAAHDHHLLIDVGDFGGGESSRFFEKLERWRALHPVEVHVCSPSEQQAVNHFRFAAAAAFRTWCVGSGLEGFSTDYALPKNEAGIPDMDVDKVALRMRYSHFGCNVVHEDVCVKPGVDVDQIHHDLKHAVEAISGRLPAEHGHGVEYEAPADTKARWQAMDPLNIFNPGIGGTSMAKRYGGK
jgi:D-lactate dehydrogenase